MPFSVGSLNNIGLPFLFCRLPLLFVVAAVAAMPFCRYFAPCPPAMPHTLQYCALLHYYCRSAVAVIIRDYSLHLVFAMLIIVLLLLVG